MIFIDVKMQQPIHILNQMGILTSFSVAQKVTEEDMRRYFSKQKRHNKSDKEIEEMIKTKILGEITTAINNQQIPGLLSPQEMAEQLGLDKKVIVRIPELNRLIMIIAHKLAEKNYDKMSLCYFINSLVNLMGLVEKDFQKFHNQNNDDDDDDGDDKYKDA